MMADRESKFDNKEKLRLVAALVIFGLLIAFVFTNTSETEVSFVFFHKTTRVIYALIVAGLLGILLDRLWIHRRRD
jgi:uncharacterized integral membrane protein